MKINDFDQVAAIYDQLAKLIFGKSIINAQKFFLHKIPDEATVLILGGGTGWILQEITKIKPKSKIIFIDASQRMIAIAQSKLATENIQFVIGTENEIPDQLFDVVITNFYLDLFSTDLLNEAMIKIKNSLTPQGIWLATDFVNKKWWHKILLKLMYVFFKATCNIEADQLVDWNSAMNRLKAKKIESRFFYRNFIEAAVFQF